MFPILHRLIYGLLSGFTEFLPVSSQPHQNIYTYLTGFHANDPWLKVSVLLGSFIALVVSLRKEYRDIHEGNKLYAYAHRRHKSSSVPLGVLTGRLYKTIMIPMLISVLFYGVAQKIGTSFPALIVLLLINGFLVALPRFLPAGDKDGRYMTKLDAFLMGLGGALGVIPGLSRVGCACALGEAKGCKPSYVLNLVLLATVWPLLIVLGFSILGAISYVEAIAMPLVLVDLGACVCSFVGAFFGIKFLRWFTEKLGLFKFAFYSWVFCLVVFILYMFV